MKTMRTVLWLVPLAFLPSVFGQTVTGYGVSRLFDLTQTTSGAPVASSGTPYSLSAYVFGSSLSGSYTFSFSGGTETSPQSLTVEGGGSAKFESASSYADLAALNTAYGTGSFSMSLNTSGGTVTPSLPGLPSGGFPETPQITSGTWIGGLLQIDPTQNYTINFAAFSSFNTDDSYRLSIRDQSDAEVASGFWNTAGTTSFVVNSGVLTAGQTYSASLQFNNNSIDYGVALAGANGNISYSIINEFSIQAVPEPSTYAVLCGAVALVGAAVHRRRRLLA